HCKVDGVVGGLEVTTKVKQQGGDGGACKVFGWLLGNVMEVLEVLEMDGFKMEGGYDFHEDKVVSQEDGKKVADILLVTAELKGTKIVEEEMLEDIDWSGHVDEDAQNYAMMAYSLSNSGSDNKSVFMNKVSDLEDTSVNDRYADGMHAVPPSMTGNYMPSGLDVEMDYSIFTYGPKQTLDDELDSKPSEYASCESDSKDKEKPSFAFTDSVKNVKTSRENVKETGTPNHSPKAEQYDRNGTTRKGLGYALTRKACFVCGSFSHLIRDCDFHKKRMAKQAELTKSKNRVTSQRENKPVWNNVQRVNHQNKFVPSVVLTKTGKFPVNAARQNYSSQAASTSTASKVNTARPFDDPRRALKDKGIIDNGCSRQMTRNRAHLADYQEFKGGSVAFGGSNERITGKGKIKAGKLDFEDAYYVEELKHYNLFSVSQMCDKKNKVLFADIDYLVLSPEFKLPDENQVLLKIPRQHNMYSFNFKNIEPSGDLACLFTKASIDESNKWHRRLGHVNFKNLNKLVKGNLVRGLPFKIFENDHTCVACQKGKQHEASCKAKIVSFVNQPLQILHMDLFGPTSVRSINHKNYYLVITDGFSRSDNETEFKNNEPIEFCRLKGIKREYSNARTPQQNGVAERKNMTLIEAAKTMVLLTKPQNKTPYEILTGKQLIISYLRPFGCHVTILNTIDQLVKFDGKSDLGFLVGYSLNSKPFRVYNLETKRVEENLHVNFLENKPNVVGKGHAWMFDLNNLANSMNFEPISVENQANKSAGLKEANNSASTQANDDQSTNLEEIDLHEEHFVLPIWSAYSTTVKAREIRLRRTLISRHVRSHTNLLNTVSTPISTAGSSRAFNDGELSYPNDPLMPYFEDIYASLSEGIFTDSSYDDEGVFQIQRVWILVDLPFGKKVIRTKWVYRNKKDERRVVVRNKKSWYDEFEELTKNRFQMSSIGELTFFLGLQVKQKEDGIFISQDEYVAKILKKFDFLSVKTASTPIETQKPLVKDKEATNVDVHLYSKELASPKKMALEQMATGKEISNLFMAGSLPKTTLPTRSSVSYALTASPTIRTSCIQQFWITTKVKTINDEVRIQALIDEKRVNIKESSIRHTLKLNDTEGTSCLANAEIFYGLAKMGYEKLYEKLTFYKAFFSPQWKFLIHTILQCLSTKTTSWDEFSSTMASTIICLTTNQKFNFSRFVKLLLDHQLGDVSHHKDIYANPSLTKKVFANMKRVGAGLSRVVTAFFDTMLVPAAKEDSMKLKELMDLCTHLSNKVLELESEVIDIRSSSKESIEKCERRVTKLDEENRVFKELHSVHSKADTAAPVVDKEKSFKQGRIIADIDEDDVDEKEPVEVEEVLKVVKAAKLMTKVVTTAGATITAEAPKVSVPRRKRGVIIQDHKETTSTVVMHSKVQQLKCFTFSTTQMFLLVEKRYPLTHFTLEQMLNNVRLKVEKVSEMSLKLLRLVRRQLIEGYVLA
nr:hypothetical protein [Tanacetum cinerariifolium]